MMCIGEHGNVIKMLAVSSALFARASSRSNLGIIPSHRTVHRSWALIAVTQHRWQTQLQYLCGARGELAPGTWPAREIGGCGYIENDSG